MEEVSGNGAVVFGIHQSLGQRVPRLDDALVLETLIPRIRSIRLTAPPVRWRINSQPALANLPVEVEAL